MNTKPWILISFLAIGLSACGSSGELTVYDAWARPASAGDNGAAYFVIENGTNADDSLVSASADIAGSAEAHMSMVSDQGVASMQMQQAVQIPAGDSVAFQPGGLHLMLVNLNRELKVGDTFSIILKFEKAGDIPIQIEVKEEQ